MLDWHCTRGIILLSLVLTIKWPMAFSSLSCLFTLLGQHQYCCLCPMFLLQNQTRAQGRGSLIIARVRRVWVEWAVSCVPGFLILARSCLFPLPSPADCANACFNESQFFISASCGVGSKEMRSIKWNGGRPPLEPAGARQKGIITAMCGTVSCPRLVLCLSLIVLHVCGLSSFFLPPPHTTPTCIPHRAKTRTPSTCSSLLVLPSPVSALWSCLALMHPADKAAPRPC